MTHVRKLQRLGSSSLVVSLPKKWVKQRGLRQGDTVYIDEGPDGLIIHSTPTRRALKCSINADEVGTAEALARLLTACYLQGFDEVRMVSVNGFTQEQLSEVQTMLDRLPGFEVIEQTQRKVVIQAIVDPTRFTVESILRRMHVMDTSMLSTAIDAVVEVMPERAGEVSRMESKLDELYFLCVRQLLLSLRDTRVAESIGIESYQAVVGYRVVAKVLEEIGDYALGISRESINIKRRSRSIERELSRLIMGISDEILTIFGRTVKAFLSVDYKLANDTFEYIRNLITKIGHAEYEELERLRDPYITVSLRVALRHLIDVLNGCKIISEITMNKFVRQRSNVCWEEAV